MVSEARKQSMAWMETDYSKHTYFQWKVKWRLEHLGALGTMGEAVSFQIWTMGGRLNGCLQIVEPCGEWEPQVENYPKLRIWILIG